MEGRGLGKMSHYATMVGMIRCPDRADLGDLRSKLTEYGWMTNDCFVDEDDEKINDQDNTDVLCGPFENVIFIPFGWYRNLSRFPFFPAGTKRKGYVIAFSTDGCFDGYLYGPGFDVPKLDMDWFSEHDRPDINDLEEILVYQNSAMDEFFSWAERQARYYCRLLTFKRFAEAVESSGFLGFKRQTTELIERYNEN